MHVTGYPVQHKVFLYFLWVTHLQCTYLQNMGLVQKTKMCSFSELALLQFKDCTSMKNSRRETRVWFGKFHYHDSCFQAFPKLHLTSIFPLTFLFELASLDLAKICVIQHWTEALNNRDYWYFVTKIVLTYCEKKLF